MAHDENRIFVGATGVEIPDIHAVTGAVGGTIGSIIRDGADRDLFNKWTMGKPVRLNLLKLITKADRASVHCGLAPVSVPKILAKSIFYNGGSSSYTKQDGLDQISEWNYLAPRGLSYGEWFRIRDFEGYDKRSIAPDSGWESREYEDADLERMVDSSVSVTQTGDYAGRNFLLSTYQSGDYGIFYSGFNMRFGDASSESIGTITYMDIPIKYITELSGNWRLCIAVWVPAHGNYTEGWALFVGNSTIAQFFIDHPGSASNMRDLLPNLTSNPVGSNYIKTYVDSKGGYAKLDAVPLLVKDVTFTYNGQAVGTNLVIRADSVTDGYCMPSGMGVIDFHFGTPPMPTYYRVSYVLADGFVNAYLSNIDATASHKFGYNVLVNGVIQTTGTATMSAGETNRLIYRYPSGNNIHVDITSQDDVPITNT